MRAASYFFLGLGSLMLIGYGVIGWRAQADFVHEPFVMLPASLVLIAAGLVGRFVLPRL